MQSRWPWSADLPVSPGRLWAPEGLELSPFWVHSAGRSVGVQEKGKHQWLHGIPNLLS